MIEIEDLNSDKCELLLLLLLKVFIMIGWRVVLFLGGFSVCQGKPTSKCGDNDFPCNDGSCVDKSTWCDTTENCLDGSDELYCFPRTHSRPNPNRCDESFFLCKDGRCIPIIGHCDGYPSCLDYSDEEDCGTANETTVDVITSSTKVEEHVTELSTATSEVANHSKSVEYDVLQADSVSQITSESNEALEHLQPHHTFVKADSDSPRNTNESNDTSNRLTPFDNVKTESNFSLNTNESDDASTHTFNTVKADESTSRKNNESKDSLNHLEARDSFVQLDTIFQNSSQSDDSLDKSHYDHYHHYDQYGKLLKQHKATFQNKVSKEEDLKQKFVDLNSHEFRIPRANAQKWLLKVRDASYGWGDETARAITALYMSNEDLMKQSDKLLMSNQLNLKIFAALMRNETKQVFLGELALFINALSASGSNPRNFYGEDLVNILRERSNVAPEISLVNPFVYLVLCLNNATSHTDVKKLQKFQFLKELQNIEIGVEAMAFLASTCVGRNLKLQSSHLELPTFLHKIRIEGLPENVYDLALLAQALNEARINQDLWNRTEVMNRIIASQLNDGSFGDILSTYYVMPLLSGKSLVSLHQNCHQNEDKGLVPVDVLKNGKEEKRLVTYTLRYGIVPEMSQTLTLTVKKSTNFFDVMRISETINPTFKFRYATRLGKPYVYSIGGVVNDAEKGLYWSLYVGSTHQRNDTVEQIGPFEGDIRNLVLSSEQYAVYWLKSVF